MSETKRNVPKLRFPGFTEDWEQRKLGEILKVNSGKDYKHLDSGDIPVYGTGGYMLSVSEALSKVDAIGIGRKGTIDKPQYLKAPFWTVDTLFYLVSLEGYSCSFLYHLSNLIPWKKFDESTGVPSLSKSTIDSIQVNIPNDKKEQDTISILFDRMNNLITLHQRKLENLKLKKKALLQKLFPKNGEQFPELRFPGFTDAWEQRKLGDVVKINPKTEVPNQFKYIDLESVVGSNLIDFKLVNKESAPSRAQRLASYGDVFYQTVRPYQRNNYLFEEDDQITVFSSGYAQLRSSLNGYFLLTLVQHDNFVKDVLDNCTGTSYPAITGSELAKINVNIPKDEGEINKIGESFRCIDNLITLHQRKLEHLKLQKKALLQQMFV